MRLVRVPRLDRDVSAIGFGCASLGSRISASHGRRAIAQALDLGLSWFDVAPSYGDGQAESLLGAALRGRRDKIVICTKFGIKPAAVPLPARLMRPLARRAVAAFPALRGAAAKARPLGQRAPIDPATIEASVTTSLRQLGTDYIDVLAVHEPTLQDIENSDIFDVLRRLVERGLVRALSIAGAPQCIEQAIRMQRPIDLAQFPDTPLMGASANLRESFPASAPMFITHGVFGGGIAQALEQVSGQRQTRLMRLAEQHGIDVAKSPNDLLLRFAFSNNPNGIVLVSMFGHDHIARNAAVAGQPPIPGLADALRHVLS